MLNELLNGPDGDALDQEITDQTVSWIEQRKDAHSYGFERDWRLCWEEDKQLSLETDPTMTPAEAWEKGFLYAWNLAHEDLTDQIGDNGWGATCGE